MKDCTQSEAELLVPVVCQERVSPERSLFSIPLGFSRGFAMRENLART